ncbi:MAG: radical SAM family heme chaperone HemW [Candidatus Delongbacteria bacterium]|nr:radical SAM family heme chaperone HemW [Candidatus Delongbacteria bacterium]MBN2836515.1 radical SAM family heme chaperone HemW [Candidatus Delongbacteria bacterium]
MKKIRDLYIHIPFCKKRCPYCDFYSTCGNDHIKYIDALLREYLQMKNLLDEKLDTIYFGGGTPSILSIEEMDRIIKTIFYSHDISTSEITIELNPGEIDKDKLVYYKSSGFNRVSVGVQSFRDSELKTLGRIHNGNEAIKIFDKIRSVGFDNFNLDLISGIPGQNIESMKYNLEMVKRISPNHVSAYMLTYYEGTKLTKLLNSGKIKPCDEDLDLELYNFLIHFLEEIGIKRYEISNYAKDGYKSKHNSNVWDNGDYLGLGVSAHSKRLNKKWWSPKDFKSYVNTSDFYDFYEEEISGSVDLFNERMMLSLRTINGVTDKDFLNEIIKSKPEIIGKYLKSNKIIFEDEKFLRLSKDGFNFYDEIVSDFFIC